MVSYACMLVKDSDFSNLRCVAHDSNKAALADKAAQYITQMFRSDLEADDELVDFKCMYHSFHGEVNDVATTLLDELEGPWDMLDVISFVSPYYGSERVFLTMRKANELPKIMDDVMPYKWSWAPPRRAFSQEEAKQLKQAKFNDVECFAKIGSMTRDWTLIYEVSGRLHSNPKAARTQKEVQETSADIKERGLSVAVFGPGDALAL